MALISPILPLTVQAVLSDLSLFQAGMKEVSWSGCSAVRPKPTGNCTGMPSASRY